MNEFWIVRFVRKDGKPDEEYYYPTLADAEHHRDLFLDDDSGLYEKIEIIKEKTKEELVYNRNLLKYIFLLLGGVISLIILVVASITIGNYETSFNDVLQAFVSPESNRQVYNIIVYSRIPRLIASLIVGAALATAGLVYQEIFKNNITLV